MGKISAKYCQTKKKIEKVEVYNQFKLDSTTVIVS